MADTVTKDQVEAAPAVAEAQPVEATAPAPADETPKAEEAQNGADKKADEATKTEVENGEQKKAANGGKPTARPDPSDFKKNRKYDPTTQPISDDPVKIRNQVEFYFSDSNLPTDKFMWESTGGEQNKPMSLKTICSFKRMRQFQPYSAVVAALRESTFLVVEGEENQETVKRRRAYVSSTEAQKARLAASVYAKGFGEEEPSTQFDIEAFFANYGHIKHVKLRRTNEELFKGSVFVEFESAEEAEAFVNLDPKPTWKGNELLIMKKKDYLDEKNRQIKEGLIEPNTNRKKTFFEGKERGGSRGGRGGFGARDNKNKEQDNNDRKNGFKGGRGGRGRGRGGRGFRGGNRNGGSPRDDRKKETRTSTNDVQVPTIQSTEATNGKRAREDDAPTEAPAAKKVDAKPEPVAAQ
ncbi:hypothetical protein VTJ49DRAFT_3917 [Mycothermus thermophilus]|uniref:Uncharacterized protein n=1 Tax=Humicola insolens TaxID=85995 RepID=A0ABR3VM93_HUMIN